MSYHSRSPLNVSSPTRWLTMSRIVNSLVTHGSYIWKSGRYFETLSFQFSLSSSTRIARLAVVNAFVFEAIANSVFSSTLSGLPSSRTP